MGSHQSTLATAGHDMWRLAFSLSAALVVQAIQLEDGVHDHHNQALVLEGVSSREGRQLRALNDVLSPLLAPPLGTPCQSKDGKSGLCMSLKSCYPYFKISDFDTRDTWVMGLYDTCSYLSPQGREVFGVCCNNTLPAEIPEEPVSSSQVDEESNALVDEFPLQDAVRRNCGYRSIQAPQVTLYNQSPSSPFLYLQGLAQPYIVNGVEAVPHEFPFMAALMNRNRQFCGGSLIDERHILTAAHCVAHMSKYDVQNLRVRLGDHNIKDGIKDGSTVEKRVKRVIRHKGFSSSTLWNDVAILTMEDDVQFNNNIQPICLARGSNSYVDRKVTVAGWGTLSEGGSQPSNLMKVDVKVWTNARCKSSYGSSAPGGITSHMLCASDNVNRRPRDSCSGDSGGPLFSCPYNGSCEQIGIVSWGIGCAKERYPGVYTRVTEMMPWISRIVAEY